ncbi:hypothetical protein [Thiocystis violascens]|uniref:Uncharacterized protein n=1 Tax=Thiocystis violascens (strain ATCC 17096 / DSM 198 / 6111) TaxID=765911 RepID=I3Y5J3_THIV6|nr:hypothetical protein [Thiocystis violascens]AFL72261.1 hypothetical protein Thivi_0189 [Thiocystis violascens DSM 198]
MKNRIKTLAARIGALSLALGLPLMTPGGAAAQTAPAAPDQPPTVAQPQAEPQYQDIDIDQLIKGARPEKKGTSAFFKPSPVRFGARIKQEPRKRDTDYLYTALSFFPLDPEPKVSHRMFVETPGGHILPVYVEDTQVEGIKRLGEGTATLFTGWHVYNYSKGPAILIVGYERAPLAMVQP